MKDLNHFARLIEAIEPWRAHLVLAGGWAHRLHRFHPLAKAPGHEPIVTRDTDIVVSATAPFNGDIKAALLKARFSEELSGNHQPPVTHYTLGDEGAGFYVEFLTPLTGSGVKRNGKPDATMTRNGVTAQKLKHLDLLLIEPWPIRVGSDQGLPTATPIDILVANPASFIVQKLLIQNYRSLDKQAQDILYIHDIIELFGTSLPTIKNLWDTSIRPTLPAKFARSVTMSAADTFADVSDVIRDAARIPQDRTLSPERLRATCQLALSVIFQS